MQALEIIIGIAMLLVAGGLSIYAIDEKTVIPFGASIVLAVAGGILLSHGVHGTNVKFHGKHAAIMRDLEAQGFAPKYADVFAIGGNQLRGTEVDFRVGACQVPFVLSKIAGVWRVTLLRYDGNGRVVFTARDVAQLHCPGSSS